MAEDEKITLFIGRLSLGKGLQYLIAAWPAVKALFSSAKLLFIGSGNEEPCLKQQVLDLGLKNSVIFKGAIPNDQLPVYYSAADVFVLPSILTQQGQEGMPVVIIEALLSGCWVIASKIGGVADLSGMAAVKTVVPENTKELSEKITQCLRQGRPAFDQRINNFTLSAAALAYAQKYQELIN